MSDTLLVLRSEFEAEDGSFLIQLRTELRWDRAAFTRMTHAMFEYVRSRQPGTDIPQWIAQGFWFLDGFVREWSSHPNFPRPYEPAYYDAAFARLHELAFCLFFGRSPSVSPDHLDEQR